MPEKMPGWRFLFGLIVSKNLSLAWKVNEKEADEVTASRRQERGKGGL